MISIVLVTCNRLHLLKRCSESVIANVSPDVKEIIVWDNASSDGTAEFLSSLRDPRLMVLRSPSNIGTNAYARAFRRATQPYMIELDDDVIDAPQYWDRAMKEAFQAIPQAGFLAANIVDDGKSIASNIFYRVDKHRFTPDVVAGVKVLRGPIGGYCTMTSREVYDRVGGFQEDKRFIFWHEDAAYAGAVGRAGYQTLILQDIKVFHASGPAYSTDAAVDAAKDQYYSWRDRQKARRDWVKKLLDQLPPIRSMNRRYGWYQTSAPALRQKNEG
jgi:GT2 family glycosyltransferase